MSDDEDVFETKIVVIRGTGNNDRDKFTTKITARDAHGPRRARPRANGQLGGRVSIDPTDRGRGLHDDQSSLGGVES
ncbi:hypothetical protein [Halorubrum pallidum]|uniref:Uncharacterized protein n=1 Tax=Halorubrum pallidum TaxID=1526114 RepID=A0ABD5SZT5_9EURY